MSTFSSFAQRGGRSDRADSAQAEDELQAAIALTRQGHFQEAIPHFLAVQGRVPDSYAASFNLALCYLGTRQFRKSIEVLNDLRSSTHDTPELENLLAQSYIGLGQTDNAFTAEQRSATLAPKNEKLYLFAADACMESGNYELGLKFVELGLKTLPKSAPLVFERGMFLSQMDQFDIARADFRHARELAPGSDIAYIAGAQEAFYAGNMAEAAKTAREAIEKGNSHFLLLTIFGEATIAAGAIPGQPEFADAQEALERVTASHPNYASAQVSLGKLYLLANQLNAAVAHLEAARVLNVGNPAVYASLATAYRRLGETQKADEAAVTLARLNQEQVQKIGSAPGERKAGYANRVPPNPPR